jgi:Fe-S cluster biogenesis protein NfuA/NifU-like protein involved in Fe-S cluster formation
MWDYSPAALQHLLTPANLGRLEHPTHVGTACEGFPSPLGRTGRAVMAGTIPGIRMPDASAASTAFPALAGTTYHVYLQLSQSGHIQAASFDYSGSPASVATASVLTTIIQRRHIEFAAQLTEAELSRALGGLPEEHLRSPIYPLLALRDAYSQWHSAAHPGPPPQPAQPTKRPRPAGLSPADSALLDLIEEVLDTEVRPGLALDGGDVEVTALLAKTLTLSFRGACRSCPNTQSTQRYLVEDRLHTHIDPGLIILVG